jgi:hypothetical protein
MDTRLDLSLFLIVLISPLAGSSDMVNAQVRSEMITLDLDPVLEFRLDNGYVRLCFFLLRSLSCRKSV